VQIGCFGRRFRCWSVVPYIPPFAAW
jgi:hypothetical protein